MKSQRDEIRTILERAGDRPEQRLRAVATLREHLDAAETAEVRRAVAAGASWTRIGAALGISRQAAHKRHADAVSNSQVAAAPATREAVRRAREAASAHGHAEIEPDHLLLGVASIGEVDGVQPADALRERVARIPATNGSLPAERVPLSEAARAAITAAMRDAAARGDRELRPEHLLAALRPG